MHGEFGGQERVEAPRAALLAAIVEVRLADDDQGRGPLLHAVGCGAGDFAGFRARHRDRFRVTALDRPGQEGSDPDRVPPSSRRYGALLDAALAALATFRGGHAPFRGCRQEFDALFACFGGRLR